MEYGHGLGDGLGNLQGDGYGNGEGTIIHSGSGHGRGASWYWECLLGDFNLTYGLGDGGPNWCGDGYGIFMDDDGWEREWDDYERGDCIYYE